MTTAHSLRCAACGQQTVSAPVSTPLTLDELDRLEDRHGWKPAGFSNALGGQFLRHCRTSRGVRFLLRHGRRLRITPLRHDCDACGAITLTWSVPLRGATTVFYRSDVPEPEAVESLQRDIARMRNDRDTGELAKTLRNTLTPVSAGVD